MAILRLGFQLVLFGLLLWQVDRFEPWRLVSAAGIAVAALLLSASRARRWAESLPVLAICALTLDFALDPPRASPLFALALLAACCFSVLLFLAPLSRDSRSARVAMRISLLALVFFSGSFVGEAWIRRTRPRTAHGIVAVEGSSAERLYRPDALLVHEQVPGFRGRFVHPEYRGESFVINADGFRDREWPDPMPAGEQRVLCLGDSTLVGFGVKRDEALPALLEARLEATGIDVRVLNAGVAGYGAPNEGLLLERLLERVDPRVVVVMFYDGNDLEDARVQRLSAIEAGLVTRGRIRKIPIPEADSFERAPNLFERRYWSRYSQLFRHLESRALRRFPWLGSLPPDHAYHAMRRISAIEPAPEVAEELALTVEALGRMALVCRSAALRLLLVRLPARVQVEARIFERLLQAAGADPDRHDRNLPGRGVLAACEALGIETLDLLPLLESSDVGPNPYYFLEGHPNRAGLKRISEPLAGRISEWLTH